MRSMLVGLSIVACVAAQAAGQEGRKVLKYAQAPVDNPLKGLVPYAGDVRGLFPHSLEFNYLKYADLVKDYDRFDWAPMERLLDDIAGRGHQAVVRIYLEYPNRAGAIPPFLLRDGLKLTKWQHTEDGVDRPPQPIETPDYEDANLRRSLRSFVAAFGRKYDGDPRLGFVTAGLLGTWGEWHTYPRSELFASKAVQAEVMDAYQAAFKVTPVLLRYPAGPNDYAHARNDDRPFGYHDDSFAWATLDTGKKADSWFYMPALKAAGPLAMSRWKTSPIGGEIRPEAWGKVFDPAPGNPSIQDFRACVLQTHASWLMDSGMFSRRSNRARPPADRVRRAEEEVRRMGYEFHAPSAAVGPPVAGKLSASLDVENRGVAPFYYDWRPQWGLLARGSVVKTWPASGKLIGLLPGDRPRAWSDTLDLAGLKPGDYILAIRIANPLKQGHPLKFANAAQDADAPGWLSLGTVPIR